MKRKKAEYEASFENTQEENSKQNTANKDDSAKKTKRLNMFIGIFSVLCALAIWLYASAISETDLRLQSTVDVKYSTEIQNKGYDLEYSGKPKVNFTVTGKVLAISQISDDGLYVSADLSGVNLSEIMTSKTVQLPLIFDLPEGVTCTEKSQEYIEVTITKKSTD